MLVLAAIVAVVAGDSVYAPMPIIPILKDDRTSNAYGQYTFEYETGNGISRQESGSQNDGQTLNGGWSYISSDGVPVNIIFVADHGGYQPQGSVLPVAPPLPYTRTGN